MPPVENSIVKSPAATQPIPTPEGTPNRMAIFRTNQPKPFSLQVPQYAPVAPQTTQPLPGPMATAQPTLQSISTAQKSIDVITRTNAANPAATGGTVSQALTIGQQVKSLFDIAVALGRSGMQGKQIIQTIGSTAQKAVQGTLGKEALNEILTTVGVKPEIIPHITTGDLVESGYKYLTSGFDKNTFFDSLESAATKTMQGVKSGVTATDSSSGALGGQVVGAIGAAYAAYQVFSNWGKGGTLQAGISSAVSGATAGAYLGSTILPGFGTLIGGAIGGTVGLVGGLLHSTGKDKDQLARDGVRDTLQQAGIVDAGWNLALADGSTYDIGKDGGFQLQNLDGTTRHAFDIDFQNPLAGETVGMANALAAVITGGDPKLTADYAGYFTNAALSNATTIDDAKRNLQAVFSKFGAQPEQIVQAITKLAQQGKVAADVAQAYINGFVSMFRTTDSLQAAA